MTIEAILTKHVRSSTLLATEPVKMDLLNDLRSQKKANSYLYGVLFAVVCVLSTLTLCALAFDLIKAETLRTGVLTASGLGVPFGIEWMRRVVREWSQINLLITLVSHSDEASIQLLIEKLMKSSSIGLS
jgi:hypothetical protein